MMFAHFFLVNAIALKTVTLKAILVKIGLATLMSSVFLQPGSSRALAQECVDPNAVIAYETCREE